MYGPFPWIIKSHQKLSKNLNSNISKLLSTVKPRSNRLLLLGETLIQFEPHLHVICFFYYNVKSIFSSSNCYESLTMERQLTALHHKQHVYYQARHLFGPAEQFILSPLVTRQADLCFWPIKTIMTAFTIFRPKGYIFSTTRRMPYSSKHQNVLGLAQKLFHWRNAMTVQPRIKSFSKPEWSIWAVLQ